MKLTVKDLLSIAHIHAHKLEMPEGTTFKGVSTDSRTVKPGELFFALRGERFDGHSYLRDAHAKGAVCAVTDKHFDYASSEIPALVVEDTTNSLGELARLYRRKFSIPVIAITGSNGKTTTKEMTKKVLGSKYSVLATEGNLNNHIGVPMTLFRLNKRHDAAVIEMGMNHEGEIANLCRIAEPTHGVITNIGKAHAGFFSSVEHIAQAKGELFQWLGADRSRVGFVNADDPQVVRQAKHLNMKVTYGIGTKKRVHVRGKLMETDINGRVMFRIEDAKRKKRVFVQSAVVGEHNVYNALAAAAIGTTFNVPLTKIKSALENYRPAESRLNVSRISGITIVDDTYNANPASTLAAFKSVSHMSHSGKRIFVLGDMLELGSRAEEEHRNVGLTLNASNCDYLLTYGTWSKFLNEAADVPFKAHYDQKNVVSEYLAELVSPGDLVLVKGSRGMKMEDIVIFLHERLQRKNI